MRYWFIDLERADVYSCYLISIDYDVWSLRTTNSLGMYDTKLENVLNPGKKYSEYWVLVFTKSVHSNFRAFWLAPVTWNILGYSLFCERREKWRVVSRTFQKKKLRARFFLSIHLVNTKKTIPLRVGEERWIYTWTLRVSVYIHHYSPPLWRIVVYYSAKIASVNSPIPLSLSPSHPRCRKQRWWRMRRSVPSRRPKDFDIQWCGDE